MSALPKRAATGRLLKLPYRRHVADHVVLLNDGALLLAWRITGLPGQVVDEARAAVRSAERNVLYRSIGSGKSTLGIYTVRRHDVDASLPTATFPDAFSASLDRAIDEKLADRGWVVTEHYLTLVYRENASSISRGVLRFAGRSQAEVIADRDRSIANAYRVSETICASLAEYRPIPLGIYIDERGARVSSLLSLLEYLVSGRWQPVRVPRGPINEALGGAWIVAGAEVLEIRDATRIRYVQLLDIKDYPPDALPATFDALFYGPAELVLAQSFRAISVPDALGQLKRHEGLLKSLGEDTAEQVREAAEARRALTAGEFVMGDYTFGLAVFGDSVEVVRESTNDAVGVLRTAGFVVDLVTNELDAAWFSRFPGNEARARRVSRLTSENLSDFAPFHASEPGRRSGTAWGPAITRLTTPAGSPLYFSFHAPSEGGGDDRGKPALGNLAIVGPTGGGKSVLENLLWMQTLKVRDTRILFLDVDRGSRIAIASVGGDYHVLRNGEPSGINPFRLARTPSNIDFLSRWVGVLARGEEGEALTASEEERIARAVAAVMDLPVARRRLSVLLENLPGERDEGAHSLSRRIGRWCARSANGRRGALAWAFDDIEAREGIDIGANAVTGIDMTAFLDHPTVRTPMTMYLLHRVEEMLDGRPLVLVLEEFPRLVADPVLRDFSGDAQVRIRKRNGVCMYAAQTPGQYADSSIGAQMVESAASGIFLANPAATKKDYVDSLRLSEAEFEAIRSIPQSAQAFVHRARYSGFAAPVSQIARADLTGLDDALAVLSGSDANNALADRAVDRVGDDPVLWLPEYHRLRRHRDGLPAIETAR